MERLRATVVSPEHADDRNVEVREDFSPRVQRRQDAEYRDWQCEHDERIGSLQRDPDDPRFSELPQERDLDTARRRSRRAQLPEAEEWSPRVASRRRAPCRGRPGTPPRSVAPRHIAAGGRTAAAPRPKRSGSRSSRLYNGRWRVGWTEGRRSARD